MNIKPLFLGRLAVPTITLAMGVGGGPQPHGSQRGQPRQLRAERAVETRREPTAGYAASAKLP